MSTNAVVTGATGFAGGCLARALAQRGYRVRALARRTAQVEALQSADIEIVRGDLSDRSDVERAVAGAEIIFHLAALYRSARHQDQVYRDVNVGGTRNILEAAKRHGVRRVIHCSTMGVHGNVREIPANEESPFMPGDIYQETKLEAEKLVRNELDNGLPGVIVRPAGIYGPGDFRFLKLFKSIQKRRFMMFGSGNTYYHLVYIDDLVDGMIRCAENPVALGQAFLLGGQRYTTLNELVQAVSDAVGAPPPRVKLPLWPLLTAATVCEGICRPLGIEPPLHRRRAEFFIKNRAFSIEKARRELDYQPRVDVAEGTRRTAQWYFDHGYLANGRESSPETGQDHQSGSSV